MIEWMLIGGVRAGHANPEKFPRRELKLQICAGCLLTFSHDDGLAPNFQPRCALDYYLENLICNPIDTPTPLNPQPSHYSLSGWISQTSCKSTV
jgi:hypothetical protein